MISIDDLIKRYKQLLINLLPLGRLWQPDEQPVFSALLRAIGVELARVDQRVVNMLAEADPRTTEEIIERWEAMLGLPDPCIGEILDLNERRNKIVQETTNVGGLSKAYYEYIGSQLGFDITVKNLVNFIAGRARAGDPLTNYFNRHFVAGSTAGEFLSEVGWRFYFNVEMPITAAEVFEAGDVAGTPLREFENPVIECTMMKLKPAHSAIFFTFKE